MDRSRPGFSLLALLNGASPAAAAYRGPWASSPPGRSLDLLPAGKFFFRPGLPRSTIQDLSRIKRGYLYTPCPICPTLPHPHHPPAAAAAARDLSSRAAATSHQISRPQPPEKTTMARKRGNQVYRGAGMVNAAAARSADTRVTYEEYGDGTFTAEVPRDALLKKKLGKHGKLSERRAIMRARMAEKTGVTGCGCVVGCLAKIVYPLSEVEKALLNSMSEANAVDVAE